MKRKQVAQYVFLIPGLCFFTFSLLIPYVMGFFVAFTDWNGISPTYQFVWFRNFIAMFQDKRFYGPVLNTLLFALLGTIGNNILSLSLALMVNRTDGRLSKFSRLVYFIPVCFSGTLTAFLWKFIYAEVFTSLFGIKSLLGMKETVIPAIVLIGLWNTCGINMLIYLSGLRNISPNYYEAAAIDGATSLQRFKNITLPLLTPSFTVCVTLSVTTWFKEFATTLSATGGGPAGSSRTISIYIYENLYTYNKAGYGQAISLAFMFLLVVIGLSLSSFFRRREVEA